MAELTGAKVEGKRLISHPTVGSAVEEDIRSWHAKGIGIQKSRADLASECQPFNGQWLNKLQNEILWNDGQQEGKPFGVAVL